LAALSAAATVSAVAAALLAAPMASADVAGPYFATQGLGSDPHMIECTKPAFNGAPAADGYCLYTSRDMGQSYAYPGNYYPMRYTRAYFSENGYSNWESAGTVFNESTLWVSNGGWVPDNAYHLWAPAAVKSGSYYYLFLPDVSDISNDAPPNISTTSRIAVARSTSPLGGFSYLGTIPYASGYMSDPDVFIEGSNRYLVWANGDNSTCGGFSIGMLNSSMLTFSGSTQELLINGIGVLGNCGGKGRPYMEGASLYKFNDASMPGPYTLVFAVKPTSAVPAECTTAWTGIGNANTAFEAIAYATASTPQGPYTYRGIITCGSTTEWTNQATIMQVENATGNNPWMMVYHDSPDAIKERKLHAECLFTGNGRISGVYRQPLTNANGFNACMAGTNANYSGFRVQDGYFPSTWTAHMTTPSGGSAPLTISRTAVGPWERFRQVQLGNGNFAYQALSNGKYVCRIASGADAGYLAATCNDSSSTNAQFIRTGTNASFKLRSAANNYWIEVSTYGGTYRLNPRANATEADAAVFTEMAQ
jgi:hypothetical protein